MKNAKAPWCAICETKSHNMADCQLNLKNRQNYQAVYQTNAVAQSNEQNNTNDKNGKRYDGRRYELQYAIDDKGLEEVDSSGIATYKLVDHPSASSGIKKGTDAQTVCTRIELTLNYVRKMG